MKLNPIIPYRNNRNYTALYGPEGIFTDPEDQKYSPYNSSLKQRSPRHNSQTKNPANSVSFKFKNGMYSAEKQREEPSFVYSDEDRANK